MSFLFPYRLALAAFFISLCFSFVLLPLVSTTYNANPDPDRFGVLAANIASGNGFRYSPEGEPVMERAPLYPLVLSLLFMLAGGYSLGIVQVFQAIVHAGVVFLVYKLSLRFHGRERALLIGTLTAIHPILVWYTGRIWIETFFTLLLLLIAVSLMDLFRQPRMTRGMLSGVLIGLGVLTKSVLLALPIALFPFLLRKAGMQGLRAWLALTTAMVVMVLPWTVRNYTVSGSLVPVNTSLGFNLVQGRIIGQLWPRTDMFILDYWRLAKEKTDSVLTSSGRSWEDPLADSQLVAYWFATIESPRAVIEDFAKNGITFWYLSESPTKSIVMGVLQGTLLAAVAVALIRSKRIDRERMLPVLLLIVFQYGVTSAVVGWGRYSAPLIPLLLILAFSTRPSGEPR